MPQKVGIACKLGGLPFDAIMPEQCRAPPQVLFANVGRIVPETSIQAEKVGVIGKCLQTASACAP